MAKHNPEILAPAGSRAALEAAVRSGADAVYLGATELNARRGAENFNEQQLKSAVRYCHIRGVRVYLTLNVLLKGSELTHAVDIARAAQRAGIDGIIVQDLGLARLVHEALPELPLHASTQMSVLSPQALPALKGLGFCRVVAARELNAAELGALCRRAAELDMTVEVFIHGALCMSVSGQCLLSAVLGGRSGNRGLCAGPCRLPFAAPGGTGYDLSLKDLSLLPHLGTLRDMGVASFKIEGRMKRPEYVAAAVSAARAVLTDGTVPPALAQSLEDIFSRSGFTDGYFTGKTGRMMFGVRTKEDAAAAGMAMPLIHEYYRTERQSVPLAVHAEITCAGARLSLSDGTRTVTVTGECPQKAQVRALDEETVRAYVSKLGGTPYYAADVRVTLEAGLFLRGADLNAMRRDAVDALSERRAEPPTRAECEYKLNRDYYYPARRPALVARFESVGQMPAALAGVEAVALPAEQEPPEKLPENIRLIADIPRGMRPEEISERLRGFKNRGCRAALCGELAALSAVQAAGLAAVGGVGLNAANSESVSVLRDLGCRAAILSPELYLTEICRTDTAIPKGIFAYGRLPLMLTRSCPIKNGQSCAACGRSSSLTDRRGTEFPVRCRAGFSEVLNSVPIYLADRLSDTEGLDFLLLHFTDETPDEVQRILNDYRHGGTPPRGFTRGLYYRTVR